MIFVFAFVQIANADKDELEKIKDAIKKKEAKWMAGETSISKLPKHERKLRLGTILPNEALDQGVTEEPVPTEGLPESYDWRYSGYLTSVKDQDGCGSCWALACIAQLEFLESRHDNVQLAPANKPDKGKVGGSPGS